MLVSLEYHHFKEGLFPGSIFALSPTGVISALVFVLFFSSFPIPVLISGENFSTSSLHNITS